MFSVISQGKKNLHYVKRYRFIHVISWLANGVRVQQNACFPSNQNVLLLFGRVLLLLFIILLKEKITINQLNRIVFWNFKINKTFLTAIKRNTWITSQYTEKTHQKIV